MKKLEWGRKKKAPGKKNSKVDMPGVVASASAIICAVSLYMFTLRGDAPSDISRDTVAVFANMSEKRVTYTKPEDPDTWSFWGYLSDIFSEVFGVSH